MHFYKIFILFLFIFLFFGCNINKVIDIGNGTNIGNIVENPTNNAGTIITPVETNLPPTTTTTISYNPNGYYGIYEPAINNSKTRPAIMVSKFATRDSVVSMGVVYPYSAGIYNMNSNLIAVCIGSNWWWYGELSVTNIVGKFFFRINEYNYYINDSKTIQYKVYPVKQ